VEIDEICVDSKKSQWLWIACSRYTGEVLSMALGNRQYKWMDALWNGLPERFKKRLMYTDGYGAYADFFGEWQHRLCEKGDGGTCTIEGVNNGMRHRCGALVRRTSARCRSGEWLLLRVWCTAHALNRRGRKRLERRLKIKRNTRG